MNKLLLPLLFAFTLFSCKSKSDSEVTIESGQTTNDSMPSMAIQTASFQNNDTQPDSTTSIENEYQTFYVVIADTGYKYEPLRDLMLKLNTTLNQQIDTMRRTYNAEKDLIALAENDEDEMFAGDYIPRRYPTSDLSLEYFSFYKDGANEKNIALVTGIYEGKSSADSALSILKKVNANAFVVKSEIYMGCIH